MEIIAITNEGVIISAKTSEVKEILNAVTGEKPKELKQGMKIPAIDYATTIIKIKALADNRDWNALGREVRDFNIAFEELSTTIKTASKIDL